MLFYVVLCLEETSCVAPNGGRRSVTYQPGEDEVTPFTFTPILHFTSKILTAAFLFRRPRRLSLIKLQRRTKCRCSAATVP